MSVLFSKSLRVLGVALVLAFIAADCMANPPSRSSAGGRTRGGAGGGGAPVAVAPAQSEVSVSVSDEVETGRVGMKMTGGGMMARMPAAASQGGNSQGENDNSQGGNNQDGNSQGGGGTTTGGGGGGEKTPEVFVSNDGTVDDCKDNYFNCMDQFCLLDDSEGERCTCSSKISEFDKLVETIKSLQTEAERLMNEGVEKEMLGAKASLVYGDNGQKTSTAKKTLSLDFEDDSAGEYHGPDSKDLTRRGAQLYEFASKSCQDRLNRCGKDADMVKTLYGQQVTRDCSDFSKYLNNQKKIVEDNKLAAEREVRKTRMENLDKTNKYNRGECLLALKDCVATKGGCGTNFENCLDASLLQRRTNACENVLEQCMAVRSYVEKDWKEEQVTVLAEAAKFADKNRRGTCLARVDACLEESCAPTVNDQCLTDVRIARGVCPVMDECDQLVPGISRMYDARLNFMRIRFCQNDLDSCFKDKCGENLSSPACVGKGVDEISDMCPQRMFPSCSGIKDFDSIQAGALLQVDFQLMQGCINTYAEKLNSICGADMNCLDENLGAPLNITTIAELEKYDYRKSVTDAVNKFFKDLEKDPTLAACKGNLGTAVFTSSKMAAQQFAEQRANRNFVRKMAELTKAADIETARKQCEALGEKGKDSQGSVIESVTFEPSLRNCHICRVQTVKEVGGMDSNSALMMGAAGGVGMGASVGSKFGPWGTAIGGVAGLAGGLFAGSKMKQKEFEQKLTSCEDVNM